ncbi:MAG: hypothetical protein Q7R45_13585 [Sulfuricaulis sp.]|nr:hypothetical protein [Sulfuricaulis sp.]
MNLKSFLRPAIVFPIPLGITPDKTAMMGLSGLMQNVNKYAKSMTSVASAGTAITLTAAQIVGGLMQVNTGATGGFTITTPTASGIVAELGATIPLNGVFDKQIEIVNNNSGQTGTLTAGTGVTLVGTMTIATDTKRSFGMRVLNSAAISITNIGSLSL